MTGSAFENYKLQGCYPEAITEAGKGGCRFVLEHWEHPECMLFSMIFSTCNTDSKIWSSRKTALWDTMPQVAFL